MQRPATLSDRHDLGRAAGTSQMFDRTDHQRTSAAVSDAARQYADPRAILDNRYVSLVRASVRGPGIAPTLVAASRALAGVGRQVVGRGQSDE